MERGELGVVKGIDDFVHKLVMSRGNEEQQQQTGGERSKKRARNGDENKEKKNEKCYESLESGQDASYRKEFVAFLHKWEAQLVAHTSFITVMAVGSAMKDGKMDVVRRIDAFVSELATSLIDDEEEEDSSDNSNDESSSSSSSFWSDDEDDSEDEE